MIGKVLKALRVWSKIDSEIQRSQRNGKPWYKSKTIWFNIVSLVTILLSFKGVELTEDEKTVIATAIITIVNIILRLVTHEPVKV